MTDVWPQRPIFRDDVNAYRREHDATREEVALLLGATDLGLKALMYDDRRRPSLEILKKAAALFHQPISRYIDDPNDPIGGVPVEDAPEDIRVMLRAMKADLERLPPEQRRKAFEIWTVAARGLLIS